MDWLDLLAVQGILKSLLQHHSSKASILRHSAFFTVQLSHAYMTTGKTIALTRQTSVDKLPPSVMLKSERGSNQPPNTGLLQCAERHGGNFSTSQYSQN
uniref:Phosphatase and actin regulator 4 n=1 Tax=Ovis aries TaxID=9940 RepID=A0AC11E4V6_SHEEP